MNKAAVNLSVSSISVDIYIYSYFSSIYTCYLLDDIEMFVFAGVEEPFGKSFIPDMCVLGL